MTAQRSASSDPTAAAVARTHRSGCPLDCPDGCSLSVRVEGDHVVAMDGDHRNPLTRGFICGKVRRFERHRTGPERVLFPAMRVGAKGEGRFERVSWERALERIVLELTRVRETWGPEAILPYSYGGSNGYLSEGSADERLWSRLGACKLERTFCAAPSGAAMMGMTGKMPGTPLTDYVHAELIVVWGCNPHASGIHLVPIIKEAQARGCKLVVVDPRRTPLARSADLHLPILPGSDLVVALGLIDHLFTEGRADASFLARHTTGADELRARAAAWPLARAAEEAGLSEQKLRAFAELYAAASPAVIRCGWGTERNRNGGSSVAAILALTAVAGKLGVKGGGFTLSQSGAWAGLSARAALGIEPNRCQRTVNMIQLGHALTELRDPPIAAMLVYNANPWATAPQQAKVQAGLAREDLFTVVHEQVMTDTARWADVLLPATTFLEHSELSRGYGSMMLQSWDAVVPHPGEGRSNFDVFTEISERLGLLGPDDVRDAGEARRRMIADLPDGERVARELEEQGIAGPAVSGLPFVDHFPRTPDGKLHLVPEALDRAAPGGLYAYTSRRAAEGLALISPATERTISSTFGQWLDGPPPLLMSLADAQARGIASGDRVRIWNDAGGEAWAEARVSAEVREGVVVWPKGQWGGAERRPTANQFAPDHEADLGRGACYNDARVQVERGVSSGSAA